MESENTRGEEGEVVLTGERGLFVLLPGCGGGEGEARRRKEGRKARGEMEKMREEGQMGQCGLGQA